MKFGFNTYRPGLSGVLPVVIVLLMLSLRVCGTQQISDADLPYPLRMQYAEIPGDTFGLPADSLHWQTVTKRYRNHYSAHKRLYLLKSQFTLDASLKDSLLYLCVPSSSYFCRIYVNGHFLAQRGTVSPETNDYLFTAKCYFIPSLFLKQKGEANTLTVELTSHWDNRGSFPDFRLMTLPQAERFSFIHNLLNRDVPFILFALGILNAVFFLLIFFAQKTGTRDLRYLLFALMSFLYGLSYVDFAFSCNTAPAAFLQKTSVSALFLTLIVSTLFVVEYYQIGKSYPKRWHYLLVPLLPLVLGGLVWVAVSPALKVANVLNAAIACLVLPVLTLDLAVCLWYLWRNPCRNNVMMTVAYASALAGTAIDGLELLPGNNLQLLPFSLLFMVFTLLYLFGWEFNSLVRKLFAKEAILQHQNEIMEKTIQQRTLELQVNNGKLFDAVAELKKSNAVKDRFFSIMAHDIKNPLNSMIGFSDLLQDSYAELSDEERKTYIRQICIGSNGLYKLLENLLEWSRIQIGSVQCSPALYPLSGLIDAVAPLAESHATAKGVRMKYIYPGDAKVYADKNMLITIFRNLLGNAIKFSYPGHKVELIVNTDNEEYNEFTVADEGTGMPPDKATKLFRIDSIQSTPGTDNEQGTGLGLILCKEFIDLHHGTIRVQSREGEGTRIIFHLPKQ